MCLKQYELLLQIANAQSVPIGIKDLDFRFVLVNQWFAKKIDLPVSAIVGKTELEVGLACEFVSGSHDGLVPGTQALDVQAIQTGLEQRAPCLPGHYSESPFLYCDVSRLPLRNDSGDVIALLLQEHGASSTIDSLQRTLQKSVETREDQLSILNTLMVKMMTYQELDPLLQHIAEIMTDRTIANNALILLVDETQEFIQVVASAGSQSRQNIGERRYRGAGFAGLAWETRRTQYIRDSDTNIMTNGYWPSGTQLLAEPLLVDGEVIGVAVLGAPTEPVDFSTSSGLVNSLASLAGIAIANAQSLEQSRAELMRMRALSDISKQLMSFDSVESLLNFVTRRLVDAMDINRTSGYRVVDSQILIAEVSWLKSQDQVTRTQTLPDELIAESICGWCLRSSDFANISRDGKDPRTSDNIHVLRDQLNMGATLCMPVTSGDHVVGMLTVSRDRARRNFDENEINLFCSIVNQVSSAMHARQMSDALHHQAYHDSLTHLPNRRCFEHELQNDLATLQQASRLCAVLFLDLDGFKSVNDTMGHARGDELLQFVASRLGGCVNETQLLARIGGDEFAVIARNLNDRQQAISLAIRLSESLQEPFVINDTNVRIGTSIGLSFYPADSACADELLRHADEAMYQAKAQGEPRIVCFNQRMANETQQRRELEIELREALRHRQFELHYQPQVNVQGGGVESVEALIRWNHPTKGLVSPGLFIPLAEEVGLINAIGSWVLEEAIQQLAAWQKTPLSHLRMGVNIAAPQFLEDGFCSELLRALASSNVPATLLEIEVTESIVMKDVRAVIARLDRLRAAGISVAIDDFGTGYSSLSYLRDLPLDTLKIDRAFMRSKGVEQIDYQLVNTIVLMAKGLGLNTVAEGVETQTQLEPLVELGCSLIQGFLFAKPGPASELPAVIDSIDAQLRMMKFANVAELKRGVG